MKRTSLIAAAIAVATLAAKANAVTIVNGSFETPLVPVGSYTNYLAGDPAITGWTIVGVDSAVVNTTFAQYGVSFEAQEGNQWIDLAGVTSNSKSSGVQQDVATVPGTQYQLSFYVGSANDNTYFFPTTVDLSINGGPRTSFTNPTAPRDHLNWEQFTSTFTATGSSTSITFYNGDESNNYNTSLDNVTITEAPSVPEPASLSLVGAGGVLLSLRIRRRKNG